LDLLRRVAPTVLVGQAPPGVDAAITVLVAGDTGPAPLPPVPGYDPERITYVAYTSGSTGTPKGVRVPERGVVRLVQEPGYMRTGPGEVTLRLAPLAFDASTFEIFTPLVGGASIALHPAAPPTPASIAKAIADNGVTVLWLTAGLFRLVADHRMDAFTGVRQLLTGGEVVPPTQARATLVAHPQLRLTVGYGPTENTSFTTTHHVDSVADVERDLPIGTPLAGTDVVVLDRTGQPVPPGGIGELFTGGLGLAVDYAGAPDLTAVAFINVDGHRMYRTGDLVRFDSGVLRFLGRRDRQVKVAGHRVELESIERILRGHPAVSDAYVGTWGKGSELRMVAAVVAQSRTGLVEELRDLVGVSQPRYAVPVRWAVVESLPLTGNGKVDVDALFSVSATRTGPDVPDRANPGDRTGVQELSAAVADPDRDIGSADGLAAPPGDLVSLEQLITAVWSEVLGHDDFGTSDAFFEVGGTSVQLASVRDRLRAALPRRPLAVVDLFRHPSVEALARHMWGRDA
jgi:amino acid adenylation domain-containing protein